MTEVIQIKEVIRLKHEEALNIKVCPKCGGYVDHIWDNDCFELDIPYCIECKTIFTDMGG